LHQKYIFYTYLLAILALIALPLNTSSELNNITILQLRGDYFFHILLFMPWAFFRQACKIKTLPWLLLGLLFAAGTEGLQYFLPWRAFNVNDLLANMIGVILGASLNLFFKQLLSHKSKVQL
jgi:glycopeptide antibiotics resistance protein